MFELTTGLESREDPLHWTHTKRSIAQESHKDQLDWSLKKIHCAGVTKRSTGLESRKNPLDWSHTQKFCVGSESWERLLDWVSWKHDPD